MSKVHRLIAGLAIVVSGAMLSACAAGSVATVNGEPISQSSFDQKLEGTPMARTVLQQLVQDVLIEQYAKNNNISVSDQEVTDRENQLKQNFPNGAWDQMLASRGLSETDVHAALREQIILDKALSKDVKVTPAQIKDYFEKNRSQYDKPEQVTARHILVPTLVLANQVEADLKAGKAFADEAKQYSTDPGSKDKGGDLGTFKRGQMVPAFDKAAFTLPIGQISAPVKSPFGFHIIQVQARMPAQKATLASATPQIVETLTQQQEAPLIQPFLQNLQSKATVQTTNPAFANLFPTPAPTPAASAATASAAPSAAGSPAAASPAPKST